MGIGFLRIIFFTTQLTGQCGDTYAPANKARDVLSLPEGLGQEFLDESMTWTTWSKYMDYIKKLPKVTNWRVFVGFNAIRRAVMGFDNREPTADEMEQMKELLRDAMESGAAGMSGGLVYVPATYANPTELAGGIDAVFVNGVIVYENGQLTGATPGKFIPHPGKQ